MGQIYFAEYEFKGDSNVFETGVEALLNPNDIKLINTVDKNGAGTAFAVYADQISGVNELHGVNAALLPTATSAMVAAKLFQLMPCAEVALIEPNYLRNDVAKKSSKG